MFVRCIVQLIMICWCHFYVTILYIHTFGSICIQNNTYVLFYPLNWGFISRYEAFITYLFACVGFCCIYSPLNCKAFLFCYFFATWAFSILYVKPIQWIKLEVNDLEMGPVVLEPMNFLKATIVEMAMHAPLCFIFFSFFGSSYTKYRIILFF